jgi:cation:H+ antiporter
MLAASIAFAVALIYFWNPWMGLIFLTGSAWFSYLEHKWGVYGAKHEDKRQLKTLKVSGHGVYFKLFLALAGVLAGGYLTVIGAEQIARDLGLSTSVVGLTLVALATSLPEIMVTVMSGIKGQAKLAVGNILGSNIYNILLIGGGTALITKPILHPTQGLIWFGATAILMTGLVRIYKGRNIPGLVGLGLIGLYGGYLWLMMGG